MNMHNKFKTFTLLCALHTLNSFSSAPAPADISASLKAELDRIYTMPDVEALTSVFPLPRDQAKQWLRVNKDKFQQTKTPLTTAHANAHRSTLAYWSIKNELASCNDDAHKRILQAKFDNAYVQLNAQEQELQNQLGAMGFNFATSSAYDLMTNKYLARSNQASILLADNQELVKQKNQWQQEKAQWQAERALWQQEKAQIQQREIRLQQEKAQLQQEKQALLAQLSQYDNQQAPPPYQER